MRNALIAALSVLILPGGYNMAAAQNIPSLDAAWKIVSKNDSLVRIELDIRTNDPSHKLCDANFVFRYDSNSLKFMTSADFGIPDEDYFFQKGFVMDDSAYCTVSRLRDSRLSVNIHSFSRSGISLSYGNNYTPVVILVFKILHSGQVTHIDWAMDKKSLKTFENVFDNTYKPYNEGEGWEKPVMIKLE